MLKCCDSQELCALITAPGGNMGFPREIVGIHEELLTRWAVHDGVFFVGGPRPIFQGDDR